MKKIIMTLLMLIVIGFSVNSQVCYKITGNGLKQPSYLFGTHHLAPLKQFSENQEAVKAFESATTVVGEIDMTIDQMTMSQAMLPYMVAPADSTLSKLLTPEQIATTNDFIAKHISPMYNISMFDALKPIALEQNITVMIIAQNFPGYNPAEQLDSYFQAQGKASNKKIMALETLEQQAELLFNIHSIAKQLNDLMEIIENPAQLIEESTKLNEAYAAEDMNQMLEISKSVEDDPVFFEKLLINRNNDWMTKLPAIMNDNSAFIAVGCLHLVGEYGLITQLRNAGYTIEPIKTGSTN